jgi:hypothetical protein
MRIIRYLKIGIWTTGQGHNTTHKYARCKKKTTKTWYNIVLALVETETFLLRTNNIPVALQVYGTYYLHNMYTLKYSTTVHTMQILSTRTYPSRWAEYEYRPLKHWKDNNASLKYIFDSTQVFHERYLNCRVFSYYDIAFIYAKFHRTNNCSEAYFSSWNRKNNNAPQGIWRLITTMKK